MPGADAGTGRTLKTAHLILRYGAFAVIASSANLAVQRAILAFAPPEPAIDAPYVLALALGTLVGLILKYGLDKRWIFHDAVQPFRAETRRMWRYTITGIGTTLIFWGMETAFWLVWHTDLMRETGAVLGLTIGYVVKYALDRRFVFPKVSDRQ